MLAHHRLQVAPTLLKEVDLVTITTTKVSEMMEEIVGVEAEVEVQRQEMYFPSCEVCKLTYSFRDVTEIGILFGDETALAIGDTTMAIGATGETDPEIGNGPRIVMS